MGKPYYKKTRGLRFECTGCGDCCSRPGPVFFPGEDLTRGAAFLGLSVPEFSRRYRLKRQEGVPVIDPGEGPCPLLDPDRRCSIYPARPVQCRTFPFWPEIVGRRRSWDAAARGCEGIGRGRRHAAVEIEQHVFLCNASDLPDADPW